MTTAVIPRTPPALPGDDAITVATMVQAEAVQAIVGGVLHLARFAYLPVAHRSISWTAEPIDEASPAGVSATHRVRFACSPWAEHIGVVLSYQRGSAKYSPAITAELRDAAGAVIDVGVEWAVDSGTLPRTQSGRGASATWPAGLLETPMRVTATPAAVSAPRLLNVAVASRGATIELRVASTQARVLAVDVFEVTQ